jgi:hypothetical protein
MHYWHFIITGMLLLALVMTGGCAGLFMGDLKTEIRDTSSLAIPLPVSSVLSVLLGQNSTEVASAQFLTEEKADPVPGTHPGESSAFRVKPALTDFPGTGPSQPSEEPMVSSLSGSGATGIPKGGIASCNPVAGANIVVTRVGISNKTHIADSVTEENGDFSFELPASPDDFPINQYILNFEISAPRYTLPAVSSTVVTDMVNASDGPQYTFNVCLQQPSEPNAIAFTRGGIAVIGKLRS